MTSNAHSPGPPDRIRDHREQLRAAGLRPIQIWVADTGSPDFRAAAHRQSLAVARSPDTDLDQAFVEAISDDDPELFP